MLFVLNAGNWAEQYSTIGERAFLSITMTVVGIAIVVFILALLSVVVSSMSRLINGKPGGVETTVREVRPEPDVIESASGTAGPEETAAESVSETDDALVAAITAAVSLVLSDSSQPSAGFKIRRIRRV